MFLAISALFVILGFAFLAAAKTAISEGGGKAVVGVILLILGLGALGLGAVGLYRVFQHDSTPVTAPSGPPPRTGRP